ncbi:protein-tyrosine phosphatase family protein [Frankia tisae]|uniref:protein-tyrosine phosphatase family protein n=1 Tax=Frankia tisae TaxID=2950104 RepID=UPI0021C24459|nr:protein-tyrosine phosphatase family protein [Frankia tisae]
MGDGHVGDSGTPLRGAILLPDGGWIRPRGLRHPPPSGPSPERGLYLGGARLRRRHDGMLTWPHEWVEWPDFLLPRDPVATAARIRTLHAHTRTSGRIEIACGGGVGRTGTVLACLAVLAGLPPADAVAWTRAHHHPRAIETPWQRRWVHRFPSLLRPPEGQGRRANHQGTDIPSRYDSHPREPS